MTNNAKYCPHCGFCCWHWRRMADHIISCEERPERDRARSRMLRDIARTMSKERAYNEAWYRGYNEALEQTSLESIRRFD